MTNPRLYLAVGISCLLTEAACTPQRSPPEAMTTQPAVSLPPAVALDASFPGSFAEPAPSTILGISSCFAFYYGIDTPVNLPRARSCFEHEVVGGCQGSSPGLSRAFLATMLLDAQGGASDPGRVSTLFADCYADNTVQALAEEVDKRKDLVVGRKPLDFCAEVGGTTLTIGECLSVERERIAATGRAIERAMSPKLGAEGRLLAAGAKRSFDAFVAKDAEACTDRYRQGSLWSNARVSHENALAKERNLALAGLFDYRPSEEPRLDGEERELARVFKEAADGDAEHRQLFESAHALWLAYRKAEVDLYVHVLGGTMFGKRDLERDVQAMLTQRYRVQLEEAMRP